MSDYVEYYKNKGLQPRITTYGGERSPAGYRSVQHWQLHFGDFFVADTSVPAHVAVWRAALGLEEPE